MTFSKWMLMAALALLLSGKSMADSSMDGTYLGEKASAPILMLVPLQIYLIVKGDSAYLLVQGPKGEEKIPMRARVEGNKLILGEKNDKQPMIFYRRMGDSGVIECFMCQGKDVPSVWNKVSR